MPLAPGPAAQPVPPGRPGNLLAGIALSPGGLLGGHLAGPMPGVQIGSIAGTIGSLLPFSAAPAPKDAPPAPSRNEDEPPMP